jgi:uncharacterized protein (UPF0335 family)
MNKGAKWYKRQCERHASKIGRLETENYRLKKELREIKENLRVDKK